MAKIKIRNTETITEAFEKFLLSKRAQGIADKTAVTYSQHFHSIGKHLDTNKDISSLTNTDLDCIKDL